MYRQTALIVIDSGFSRESLTGVNVISYEDLLTQGRVVGDPQIDITSGAHDQFLGDPLRHGEQVLNALKERVSPGAPVILIKAVDREGRMIRTQWRDGKVIRRGWVDAYRWAVEECKRRGLLSVANCSFGGFVHAMDGTGWEAFQLGQAAGHGHVVVAAAGPGSESSVHASWTLEPGECKTIESFQKGASSYNFWVSSKPRSTNQPCFSNRKWQLEVWSEDRLQRVDNGELIAANFWNRKQQLTLGVSAANAVTRFVWRNQSSSTLKCDGWIVNENAAFLAHVDKRAIAEPAAFPVVIAVGFSNRLYSPNQRQLRSKPEILLRGDGMLSFRVPEVTARATRILSENPQFTSKQVLAVLCQKGKVLP